MSKINFVAAMIYYRFSFRLRNSETNNFLKAASQLRYLSCSCARSRIQTWRLRNALRVSSIKQNIASARDNVRLIGENHNLCSAKLEIIKRFPLMLHVGRKNIGKFRWIINKALSLHSDTTKPKCKAISLLGMSMRTLKASLFVGFSYAYTLINMQWECEL